MSALVWTLLALATLVALGLAAVTTAESRQRLGAVAFALGTGGLLMVLGADVLAMMWLLVLTPLCWLSSADDDDDPATGRVGQRLAAGVLATGVAAAVYLLTQQMAWHGLPADPAAPQAAALVGRLLQVDTTVVAVLLLAVAGVLTVRRGASS